MGCLCQSCTGQALDEFILERLYAIVRPGQEIFRVKRLEFHWCTPVERALPDSGHPLLFRGGRVVTGGLCNVMWDYYPGIT